MSIEYISTCDLINKNLLTNFYQKPKLSKLQFSLPLKHAIKACDKKNFKEASKEIQKISFLLIYCYFSQIPKIKINSSHTLDGGLNFYYSLLISLKKYKDIYNFLIVLLIENFYTSTPKEMLAVKTLSNSSKLLHYEIFFSAKFLTNLQDLIQQFFPYLNVKDLYFKVNFVITGQNLSIIKDTKKILYNTSLFWKINYL